MGGDVTAASILHERVPADPELASYFQVLDMRRSWPDDLFALVAANHRNLHRPRTDIRFRSLMQYHGPDSPTKVLNTV